MESWWFVEDARDDDEFTLDYHRGLKQWMKRELL